MTYLASQHLVGLFQPDFSIELLALDELLRHKVDVRNLASVSVYTEQVDRFVGGFTILSSGFQYLPNGLFDQHQHVGTPYAESNGSRFGHHRHRSPQHRRSRWGSPQSTWQYQQ
jgi:hypothetical protein